MTLNQVRDFALSLAGATEEPHFHYTSFRVGRIFATAPPDGETLHVFVSEDERVVALEQEPDFLEELHWGKRVVGLRVVLASAKSGVVEDLLTKAWALRSRKKPAPRKEPRKKNLRSGL